MTCRHCAAPALTGSDRCRSHARRARRTDDGLPILGSHMLTGNGDRRDDCRGYEACIDAAGRRAGPACCPTACAHYEAADRSGDLDAIATRRLA